MSGERADAVPSSGAPLGMDCLPAELIEAVLGGMLEPAERAHSYEHVASCPACVERLTRAGAQLLGGGSLCPGRLLARRYRIIRFVAQGGMGEVYEAYDTELSVRVALKMVPAAGEQRPVALRALAREVLLARSIAHPNVCRIFDLGLHEGELPLRFLTMEFVDGERLSSHIAAGPMELGLVHGIARGLLRGLGAAHRAGVLHRDFKSDNVLLREGVSTVPQAVIMDFGLARSLGRHGARSSLTNHRVEGSLYYMAPEQLLGQALGWETDVYGFGVVLFEMLTGRTPFEEQITLGAAMQRCNAPPPRASALVPSLPPGLEHVVQRCLSPARAERYQSAEAVLAALDRALSPPVTLWSGRAWNGRAWSERAVTRAPLLVGFMTLAGLGLEADQLPLQTGELALTPAPPSAAPALPPIAVATSGTPSRETTSAASTSAASTSAASTSAPSTSAPSTLVAPEPARANAPVARVPKAPPAEPPAARAVPPPAEAGGAEDGAELLVSDLPLTDESEPQAPAAGQTVPERDRRDTLFDPFMAEPGVEPPAGARD
jgi:serine/threonine protein kinase